MRALALRPDDAILRLRLLARARSRLAGDAGQDRHCHERPDGVPSGLGENPLSRRYHPRHLGAHGCREPERSGVVRAPRFRRAENRAGHRGYFTGIIRCWYGVPGHITYGLCGLSAVFG